MNATPAPAAPVSPARWHLLADALIAAGLPARINSRTYQIANVPGGEAISWSINVPIRIREDQPQIGLVDVLDIVSKGRFVGWHVTVSDRDDIMVDQTLIPVTSVERIPGSIPTTAVVDWLQPKVDRLTAPDRLAAVDAELHSGKRMSETRFTALRVERMQLTNLLAR